MAQTPRTASVALLIATTIVAGPRAVVGQAPAPTQPSGPCALLKIEEIQPLAVNQTLGTGVVETYEPAGFTQCRYNWGNGIDHYKLDLTLGQSAQMFAGMAPDAMKQTLQASVNPDTADALIPEVGDVAVFKADSPAYVHATALVKGRVLQVHLDGIDAREKKDLVIGLLKAAASRL